MKSACCATRSILSTSTSTVLLLLLLCSINSSSHSNSRVSAFVVPPTLTSTAAGNRLSTTHLHSSTLDKKTTTSSSSSSSSSSSTAAAAAAESKRLSKAKLLLQEFLVDDVDNNNASPVPINPTATATSTSSNKMDATTDTASTPPIPDSFWSNGHLVQQQQQEDGDTSEYVTRWARGVKVAEPLVRYDPIAAEQLLFRQPAKWMVRNVQIAFPIGWWAAGVVFDYAMGTGTQNRRKRAQQLNNAISGLGPAIIKGGQALASRSDLLPSEYLEELQKLQDDVPRFSNELAFATVEQELGMPFESVFSLVEEEPIAAASIGQVYKATLLSNGDTVALKIMRPDCEEIIALDLYVLRWWSGVYNKIFELLNRDINVQSIIDDFGDLIYREIDYIAEAANAQRFNELYAVTATGVFVPKVYSELTTSKVLTMEWVDGFRLTDTASLDAYGLDKEKLVNTLVQCSLRQILENGFFHADPHAGNLLACPDGRLCYLDFGMMSYADKMQRNGFLLAVVHIVNRDWGELAQLYVKLGFIPEGTDLKPIEYALEAALPDVLNSEISDLNFKNVVSKLGDIMYTFPFSLPPFYISIIRCLGVLEGLAIQVDPQARIISEAYPYVASRVLTDPQEDLQEALRRLALDANGSIRWERLEGLLDEAKDSKGYDVTAALDLLTNYLISDDGEKLLQELSVQIVEAADSLGTESIGYVLAATRALAINDEVAAVKAFRSLESIFAQTQEQGVDGVQRSVAKNLQEVLPAPTPSMRRFGNILTLLGAGAEATPDASKFIPIVRKLAQEPRVQRTSSEILARLGERLLSRGLRAAFGLPPPSFEGGRGETRTVTEDRV